MDKLAERIYDPTCQELAIFKKTHEQWGEYSNMAAGFPIVVNNIMVRSSEALYQALKFTEHPDVQRKIISEKSPMTAKMVAKPYKSLIRSDFESTKIVFMKWCVRAKLLSNYEQFKEVLLQSDGKIIVEESKRDSFWGAKRQDNGRLIGVNVLGRILMELREDIKNDKVNDVLGRLDVPNFMLFGEDIQPLYIKNLYISGKKINQQNDFFL